VRITLDVSLTYERITARFDDGTVKFDEPAIVYWKLDRKGNRYIVGIGSDQLDRESATVEPALSQIRFDPVLAASIVSYAVMKVWNDLRPKWGGILMTLDSVTARVTLENYDHLTPQEQKLFKSALRPFPRLSWWVNGEKVKA
jgi:hypothetical protein